MASDDAREKSVRLTVQRLRTILRDDPEGFYRTVDKIVSECTDPTTREFWVAVKAFAKRTAD